MLRRAGFDEVSLDLIAGLPNQPRDRWERNLAEAIALAPDHLSLYLLELHPGTKLARDVDAGRVARPDDDLAAEMYFATADALGEAGFVQYEISNFARRRQGGGDHRSRHNEKYWTEAPYYGFGVSAHAYTNGERRSNVRSIAGYADAMESRVGGGGKDSALRTGPRCGGCVPRPPTSRGRRSRGVRRAVRPRSPLRVSRRLVAALRRGTARRPRRATLAHAPRARAPNEVFAAFV